MLSPFRPSAFSDQDPPAYPRLFGLFAKQLVL